MLWFYSTKQNDLLSSTCTTVPLKRDPFVPGKCREAFHSVALPVICFIYFSVFLLLICGMWLLVVICVLFCRQTCMIQNRTRSDEDMKVSIPMIVSACGWVSQLVKHRDTFCLWFKQEMTGSIDSSLIFFIVNSGGGGGAQQSALKHEILQTIVWTWTILSL